MPQMLQTIRVINSSLYIYHLISPVICMYAMHVNRSTIYLRLHLLYHDETARRFQCHHCTLAFASQTKLMRHLASRAHIRLVDAIASQSG